MQGRQFNPWSGKSPRAMEHLSLCTTTTEARIRTASAPQQEKPPQLESSPSLLQLEKSPSKATKTQRQPKQKEIKGSHE